MRAVILNGARDGEGHIDQIQLLIGAELERAGWETQAFVLRTIAIAPCAGCFACWVKTPGECVMPDANRAITEATLGARLVVLLTPVVFGGYSSELKKAVDHQITLVSPFFTRIAGEVHHQRRYARYPDLLGIGVQAAGDDHAAQIFARLVERHARNFHAEAHASAVLPADAAVSALAPRLRAALGAFEGVAA